MRRKSKGWLHALAMNRSCNVDFRSVKPDHKASDAMVTRRFEILGHVSPVERRRTEGYIEMNRGDTRVNSATKHDTEDRRELDPFLGHDLCA